MYRYLNQFIWFASFVKKAIQNTRLYYFYLAKNTEMKTKHEMTFAERAQLGMEKISKQAPVSLEAMRAQAQRVLKAYAASKRLPRRSKGDHQAE